MAQKSLRILKIFQPVVSHLRKSISNYIYDLFLRFHKKILIPVVGVMAIQRASHYNPFQ